MFELMPFEHRNSRKIASYDPFRDLEDFERAFFNDFAKPAYQGFRTDIKEEEGKYVIEAELPGFKKEEISVDLDGECLTISAEHKEENDEKDKKGNYLRRERRYGSVTRSFDVSNIDCDNIKVAYTDGILSVDLPKKEPAVPTSRRLTIN